MLKSAARTRAFLLNCGPKLASFDAIFGDIFGALLAVRSGLYSACVAGAEQAPALTLVRIVCVFLANLTFLDMYEVIHWALGQALWRVPRFSTSLRQIEPP